MSNLAHLLPPDHATRAREARIEWERAGIEKRLDVLKVAGTRLIAARAELDRGLYLDGLSAKLARYYGDWIVHQGSADLLERYAKDQVRWITTPTGAELLVRRPDGIVLLMTPGNSPTINIAPLFSMLLPGNAVIVRAPANDQGLRFVAEEIVGGALEEHGFSRDLVQVITGRSREVLGQFLSIEDVKTIVFFGNSPAGRSVAEQAHLHGKKVVLELEGSDHMVVWKDADLERALDSAVHAFDFSTQPCPIPKHLLVHHEIFDRFVEGLLARVPGVSTTAEADPIDGNLVPVGKPDDYFTFLEELRPHGQVRCGGYRMAADGTPNPQGAYVAPTVVTLKDSCLDRPLKAFTEEVCFPLIPVVRFEGEDATIARRMSDVIAKSPSGLRASVWTESAELITHFTRDIGSVGLLLINDDHAQCPVYASPWGGPKRSGGPSGESHLFWEKTSRLQAISANRLTRAQMSAVVDGLGYRRWAKELGNSSPKLRAVSSADVSRVRLNLSRGVLRLTLERPSRHNAFDPRLKDAFARAVERIVELKEAVRCVVVSGAGVSFSSGADLKAMSGFDPDGVRRFMLEATWAFRRLESLPVPVIAAVHGYCLGGGFELMLHTDHVIAQSDATFGLPETGIGLVTTAGSAKRLIDAVGMARAKPLLLSGRRIRGDEAERIGLVTESVSSDAFEARVSECAAAYAAMPPQGLAAMKRIVAKAHEADRASSWIAEVEEFEGLFAARGGPGA